MKYVSIDLETTGLDEETCQTIEIGAVIDDTSHETPIDQLPTFHCYVTHPIYCGEPFALNMHADIFKKLSDRPEGWRYETIDSVANVFQAWIAKHFEEPATIAGKNFMGYDMNFLKKIPQFQRNQFKHRCIDPAMLFWDRKNDTELPNLKTCMERAGIPGEVTHTALEDAFQVIKLLRYEKADMPVLAEDVG